MSTINTKLSDSHSPHGSFHLSSNVLKLPQKMATERGEEENVNKRRKEGSEDEMNEEEYECDRTGI